MVSQKGRWELKLKVIIECKKGKRSAVYMRNFRVGDV